MSASMLSNLSTLAHSSDKILYQVDSIFPFELFPDSIIVDKNKIEVIYRYFFWEKRIFTILLEDLTTVKVHTGPLFATVSFEVRGYEENPPPVAHIPKLQAVKLQEIIMGLVKAHHEGVRLQTISSSNIKSLQNVGHAHQDVSSAI